MPLNLSFLRCIVFVFMFVFGGGAGSEQLVVADTLVLYLAAFKC